MSIFQTLFHAHLPIHATRRPIPAPTTGGYRQSPPRTAQDILREAEAYLRLFHQERGLSPLCHERLAHVQAEIERTGTYWQTSDELADGAKIAWRNNTRCIGRLHWHSLHVRDRRHLESEEEIFAALVDHLRFATNGGKIRSTMTIFAPTTPGQPGVRIWNPNTHQPKKG